MQPWHIASRWIMCRLLLDMTMDLTLRNPQTSLCRATQNRYMLWRFSVNTRQSASLCRASYIGSPHNATRSRAARAPAPALPPAPGLWQSCFCARYGGRYGTKGGCYRRDRQTDGRTDTRLLHRSCIAYYRPTGSVNNRISS